MQLYTFVIYLLFFCLLTWLISNWTASTVSSYLLMVNKQTLLSSVHMIHDQLVRDIHEAVVQKSRWTDVNNQTVHLITNQSSIVWKLRNGQLLRSITVGGNTHTSRLLSKVTDFTVGVATTRDRVEQIKVNYTTRGNTFYINVCT